MAKTLPKTTKGHRFGGDWTSEKLDVLAAYLHSYTTALKDKPSASHPFVKAYIDAFAGSGSRQARQQDVPMLLDEPAVALLDGSARLALKTEPPFDRYMFIERNSQRCAQLEALKQEFPALASTINVREGEANKEIQALCSKNWRNHRAVLFLDPYGMQVKWKTIEAGRKPAPKRSESILTGASPRSLPPWRLNRGSCVMRRGTREPSAEERSTLMAQGSGIEWTESTWNPVTGCSKVSAGCKHCYAEVMARRLQAMGQPNYRNGFAVTLQPQMLELPLRWRKPQTIFVNSMSDLFHPDVPLDYVERVFAVMRRAHWHRFQVLTKRSSRLVELSGALDWPENVWMGVSVENEAQQVRADDLRSTGAAVKFLSLEPLLGPLPNLNLSRIDWVIVGGESGPGARAMRPEWVLQLRDRCELANVPFFFKQWGGVQKKRAGRTLEGRTWEQMPLVVSAQ